MKNHKVYFIGGVCGVGKTTLRKHLEHLLPKDLYTIYDFDERGVPDGGGKEWHHKESQHWLNTAGENTKHNKSTIILGFVHPERIKTIHNKDEHPALNLFMLHASGETIRKRLIGRYPTPESIKEINRASGTSLEEFINREVNFAPTLYTMFEKEGHPIIDTDTMTPEEVAKEVANQILSKSASNQ